MLIMNSFMLSVSRHHDTRFTEFTDKFAISSRLRHKCMHDTYFVNTGYMVHGYLDRQYITCNSIAKQHPTKTAYIITCAYIIYVVHRRRRRSRYGTADCYNLLSTTTHYLHWHCAIRVTCPLN